MLVILAALAIWHLMWWWAAARTARKFGWHAGRLCIHVLGLVLLVGFCWMGGSRMRAIHASPPGLLLTTTYVWYVLIVVWATPLTWLASAIARRQRPEHGLAVGETTGVGPQPAPAASGGDDTGAAQGVSRRNLLAMGIGGLPLVLTAGASGLAAAQTGQFRIRRIDVPLPGLPRDLDGLTIAHISDTHAGALVGERTLRRIVEQTNSLKPDLVLFTGDLIDHSLDYLPAGLEMLSRFDPRFGRFACEGNHDLFDDRAAFEARTSAANVGMLLNESALCRVRGVDVQILGTRWTPNIRGRFEGRDNIAETLKLRDPEAFGILLAHHPHDFDRAAAAGVPLTLAGHTHGGQLMLTDSIGAGPLLFKYWSGLYRRGDAALVVSNGTGNWFPLRVNAPAEIIHATLRRQ